MKTKQLILISLMLALAFTLTITPTHQDQGQNQVNGQVQGEGEVEIEAPSAFKTFWNTASQKEKGMAKKILADDEELLQALQSGEISKEQDEKLMGLFLEDDEFRRMQIRLITLFMPQFSFISELEKDEQIDLLKKMLIASSSGDLEAFMEIILSNENSRTAFIQMLGIKGFQSLPREKQDQFFKFAFGSPEEQGNYLQLVMSDPELLQFFLSIGSGGSSSAAVNVQSGSRHLLRTVKHQVRAYKHSSIF